MCSLEKIIPQNDTSRLLKKCANKDIISIKSSLHVKVKYGEVHV